MSEPLWVPLGASSGAGDELAYAQVTSTTSVSATTEGAANTVVTAAAVQTDGVSPILIEFFAQQAGPTGTTSATITFWLYQDGVSIGAIGRALTPAAVAMRVPVLLRRRLVPASGSHVYSIRASVSAATGQVVAGTGLITTDAPAFVRISAIRPATGAQTYISPELAYAQFTAPVNISARSQPAANTIVTAPSFTSDGTPVLVEIFTPHGVSTAGQDAQLLLDLFEGATHLGSFVAVMCWGGVGVGPFSAARRLTPSVGAHTYSLKAWTTHATATVDITAGTGTATAIMPGFIRVSRA